MIDPPTSAYFYEKTGDPQIGDSGIFETNNLTAQLGEDEACDHVLIGLNFSGLFILYLLTGVLALITRAL